MYSGWNHFAVKNVANDWVHNINKLLTTVCIFIKLFSEEEFTEEEFGEEGMFTLLIFKIMFR